MGNLNALNADLAQQPEELQHAAAQHAAAASAESAAVPQPAPAERKQSAVDKKMAQLRSIRPPFGKKKKEDGDN